MIKAGAWVKFRHLEGGYGKVIGKDPDADGNLLVELRTSGPNMGSVLTTPFDCLIPIPEEPMTDQEYADYLADPLNRAFVQEYERRSGCAELRKREQERIVQSVWQTWFEPIEKGWENSLRKIEDSTTRILGNSREINSHTEAANIWHAIQTLVLIAGLLGIVATQRGWW